MFTGIITDIGEVSAILPIGANRRVTIATNFDLSGMALGASIACEGICLTATDYTAHSFTVDISPETLEITTAKDWQTGQKLNLERSLKLGDELGGHLVSGHVDGLGQIASITPEGGSYRLIINAPTELMPFIAHKGSIAVDGISLTVNDVSNTDFSLMIIPHTWEYTTLRYKRVGDAVNLEIDMLARYIARQMQWTKP